MAVAHRLLTFGIVAFYIVLLHITYVRWISLAEAYRGYIYLSPSWPILFASWAASLLPIFFLPTSVNRPSDLVLLLIYFFAIIPSGFMPAYTLQRSSSDILIYIYSQTGAFLAVALLRNLPELKLPRLNMGWPIFSSLLTCLACVVAIAIAIRFGFSINLVSFADVYDLRSTYKANLAFESGLIAYALGWLSKVFAPLLIAIGFFRKNIILLSGGAVLQLWMYSMSGHKSTLLSLVFLPAILILISGKHPRILLRLSIVMCCLVVLAFMLDVIFETQFITSLLVRRLLLTPGLLSGYYLDFFIENPIAMLGDGILAPIVNYPYDRPVAYLVGATYFLKADNSSNVHFLANAFAHFGYAGVWLFATLCGLVLWFLDQVSTGRPAYVIMPIAGLIARTLSEAALLTSLVTHGLIVLILLIWLMPGTTRINKTLQP